MMHLKNLSVTFNRATEQEFRALDDLSLSVLEGEFIFLLGANGSGKSTLLNVIAGNVRTDLGKSKIELYGEDISHKSLHVRAKHIARVFQQPTDGIAAELSIVENFRLAALRSTGRGLRIGTDNAFRNEIRDRIAVLGMGLEDKLDRTAGSFSGGQRQALSLLMATYLKPKLLLLDEPTAALDPKSAETVFRLACSIIEQQNLTAIMVTHDLRHCLRAGSRIIHLHEGRIAHDVAGLKKQEITLATLYEWFDVPV
ncbi:MAG: ABC transporter ATP-binding protein [Bacteroidia bacterium]